MSFVFNFKFSFPDMALVVLSISSLSKILKERVHRGFQIYFTICNKYERRVILFKCYFLHLTRYFSQPSLPLFPLAFGDLEFRFYSFRVAVLFGRVTV